MHEAAEAAGITLAFLPFLAPELIPREELWRGLEATVAANQCYPTLKDLTQHAIDWLDAMNPGRAPPPLWLPVVQIRLVTYLA